MPSLTLDLAQYEALIALSRKGATSGEELRAIDTFLREIEKANNLTRYGVWVQWQEAKQHAAGPHVFPNTWPPTLREYIELTSRPIARTDVDALLAKRATNPVTVLVTTDPAGVVGWQTLDHFFGAP